MKRLVSPPALRSAREDSSARKVSWLELFYDLIFVAAVAQVAEPLRHHFAFGELPRLAPLLVLIWWAWTGHAIFSTRFGTDDVVQRVLTLVQMFVVAVMAANATDALDSESSAGFAAAYAVVRLMLVGQYWRARSISEARTLATRHAAGHGVAALMWLASAMVPVPMRFWLWALAIVIDIGTPWLALRHNVDAPPDPAHLPERFGLFTIILLGESVVAVMQGMESQSDWTPAAAASALLAMGTLFVVWWWYFDGVSGASERHVRTTREAVRLHLWSYAHFPLSLGIIVTGVGIRHLVTLASRATMAPGELLLLMTGLALVMVSMIIIGATADERRREGRRLWPAPLAIAAATVALGVVGPVSSPPAIMAMLAGLCLAQLALAEWQPGGHAPAPLLPSSPSHRDRNATAGQRS